MKFSHFSKTKKIMILNALEQSKLSVSIEGTIYEGIKNNLKKISNVLVVMTNKKS